MRFADDFVMAFEDARSGRRMLDVLGKRLGRYGLTLHGIKTRYVVGGDVLVGARIGRRSAR